MLGNKCDRFDGYRKPTQRESEYIKKALYNGKRDYGMLITIVLLGGLGFLFVFIGILVGVIYKSFDYCLICIVLGLMWICVAYVTYTKSYREKQDILKTNYDVLKGKGDWVWSLERTVIDTEDGKTEYTKSVQRLHNFCSKKGEIDTRCKIEFAKYSYLRYDGLNQVKSIPVMVIRINKKVKYAIPDWEVIEANNREFNVVSQFCEVRY